jgi:hypothetical protein
MSENRIRKTDTVQVHGPASVGIWFGTDKVARYNPDGTVRYLATEVVTEHLLVGSLDANVFIAPFACKLIRAQEVHGVVGGAGCQVDVKKCTGTTAPASGTTMLASVFDLTATINTVVDKALAASAATLTLAVGDRVALDFGGTMTGLVGSLVLTFVQV